MPALATSTHAEVVLHAFEWPYREITRSAPEIGRLGYKAVLVGSPLKTQGENWWARYQPQDYRVIDSPLGNKKDFVEMINALAKQQVKVYADLVLNHMADEGRQDLNYPGEKILRQYASNWEYFQKQRLFGDLHENLFSYNDFHLPRKPITDYEDPGDTQYNQIGTLPDLKANDWVISQQRNYLAALLELGVSGFRIDAAKHMTRQHIKSVFTDDLVGEALVFAEIITGGGEGDRAYDAILAPFVQDFSFKAYDFPLFTQFRKVFSEDGNIASLLSAPYDFNALKKNRAVVFSINHDIPNNEIFWNMRLDERSEYLANVFLLARSDSTCLIYSDNAARQYSWGSTERWKGYYRLPPLAQMIKFHNTCAGTPMVVIDFEKNYLVFSRIGKGLVIINNANSVLELDYSRDKLYLQQQGTLVNLLDDTEYTKQLDINSLKFRVEPRSAQMWLVQ